MLEGLLERFRRRDRLALSRLLSLLARGQHSAEIIGSLAVCQGCDSRGTPPRVVALTGSGGVGKSSLAGRLIESLRDNGLTVAVLACDPQSPLSGGALLGDRFRMPSRADDDGVFIRSLAAPGGQGAVAGHLDDLIRLLAAFGFDIVLLETVGAGQGDTAVRDLADVVVLLLQPETGDDLQWEKAGVLEVADVIVIHKADLPGAANVEAQVRATLAVGDRPPPPILRVSSRSGAGVTELRDVLLALPLRQRERPEQHELLALGQQILAERFARAEAADDPELLRLRSQWQQGQVQGAQAAAALWTLLEKKYP
jgi:2-methylcitrate dehydratase